tara:strand:- start:189 stop:410 length:222 start_codon:yes stop_codon:yes gene_type:complete
MKYNINELENKFKNIDEKNKIIEKPIYIENNFDMKNSTYLENKEDILQLYLYFILSGYIYCMKQNQLTEYEVD